MKIQWFVDQASSCLKSYWTWHLLWINVGTESVLVLRGTPVWQTGITQILLNRNSTWRDWEHCILQRTFYHSTVHCDILLRTLHCWDTEHFTAITLLAIHAALAFNQMCCILLIGHRASYCHHTYCILLIGHRASYCHHTYCILLIGHQASYCHHTYCILLIWHRASVCHHTYCILLIGHRASVCHHIISNTHGTGF